MPKLAANLSRLGTETAFEVLARAGKLAAAGKDIINLGIGQPDFKTPPHIVEAAIKAMRDGHHGYTPANGIPALREAVAVDIAKYRKVDIDPDSVMIMPGGKPTMFFAILMFGEPGAEIIYPNPGFPIYESMIRYSGATPVPMRLLEENGFTFSAEAVLEQITPATRLLILNSPANPTGGVVPKAEFDALVAGLEKHPDVAILADEIYSRLLSGNPRPGDPAGRLVQDLRDDRLAARLQRLAEGHVLLCGAPGGEQSLLRQRADAVCRHRRAARPAGRRR